MKVLQRSLNSEIGITISFLLLRIVAIYQIWMDPLPMRSRVSMALLQDLPVVVHLSQLCLQLRSILVPVEGGEVLKGIDHPKLLETLHPMRLSCLRTPDDFSEVVLHQSIIREDVRVLSFLFSI